MKLFCVFILISFFSCNIGLSQGKADKEVLRKIDANIMRISHPSEDCRRIKVYNALIEKYILKGARISMVIEHMGEPNQLLVNESGLRFDEIYAFNTSTCNTNINGKTRGGQVVFYCNKGEVISVITQFGGG